MNSNKSAWILKRYLDANLAKHMQDLQAKTQSAL